MHQRYFLKIILFYKKKIIDRTLENRAREKWTMTVSKEQKYYFSFLEQKRKEIEDFQKGDKS